MIPFCVLSFVVLFNAPIDAMSYQEDRVVTNVKLFQGDLRILKHDLQNYELSKHMLARELFRIKHDINCGYDLFPPSHPHHPLRKALIQRYNYAVFLLMKEQLATEDDMFWEPVYTPQTPPKRSIRITEIIEDEPGIPQPAIAALPAPPNPIPPISPSQESTSVPSILQKITQLPARKKAFGVAATVVAIFGGTLYWLKREATDAKEKSHSSESGSQPDTNKTASTETPNN